MASKGEAPLAPLPASPKWTRPSDVMKIRQLKRRIKTPGKKTPNATFPIVNTCLDAKDEMDEEDGQVTKKRKKNPFSVSPRKRLNMNKKVVPTPSPFATQTGSVLNPIVDNDQSSFKSSSSDPLAFPLTGLSKGHFLFSGCGMEGSDSVKSATINSTIPSSSSFLELISSISDESQDCEMFQLRQNASVTNDDQMEVSINQSTQNVSMNSSSFNCSNSNSSCNMSTSFGSFSQGSPDDHSSNKLLTSLLLPVDWSLKTRIRLQADTAWPWHGTLKTMDEAAGVSSFLNGGKPGLASVEEPLSWHSQIQGATLVWSFPTVPGLVSFPRYCSNMKNVDAHPLTTQPRVVEALQHDYAAAFTSAFNQLKGSKSPYFYLCAQRFTILFRSDGLGGQEDMSVEVTPTSKGLRDGLTAEGVDFEMPLSSRRRSALTPTTLTPFMASVEKETNDEVEDEDNVENTAAHNWLESMGIDKTKFPSLNPSKVSMAQDNFKVIDGRPESLVRVQGLANVQALFNFLLNNSQLTIASSGSQAGIPPTILSPVAFKGAALKQLRYTHGTMRYKSTKASQILHTLDIVGPILPHHVLNIVAIARTAPIKAFTLVCNNQDSTFAFNHQIQPDSSDLNGRRSGSSTGLATKLSSDVEETLVRSGLRQPGVVEMAVNRLKEKTGIRESYFEEEDNGFTSVLQ